MKKNIVNKDTQFAVLGLGKFGRSLAQELFTNGYGVLCCDIDEHLVDDATTFSTYAVQGDVTDEAVLEKIGVRNADIVIVSFSSDFEASVVTSMALKDMKIPYILAKANGARQKQILESIGVNRVVLPEKEMGERVAIEFMTDNLFDYINNSDDYSIFEMPPKPHWVGKSLEELELRRLESINLIALVKDHKFKAVLDPKTIIHADDSLIVLKAD